MAERTGKLLPLPGGARMALVVAVVTLLHAAEASMKDTEELYKRKAGTFIVRGEELKPNSQPYMVYLMTDLGFRRRMTCGGAAIERRWILTAAHCFTRETGSNPEKVTVFAGMHSHDPFNATKNNERYKISKVFIHPDYNKEAFAATAKGLTYRNDVALLYLDRELDLDQSSTTKLISLNHDPDCPKDGDMCHAAGWGNLKATKPGERPDEAQVAHWANLSVTSYEACRNHYQHFNYHDSIYDDAMICTGEKGAPYSYTCNGDSGGSLVCKCPDSDGKLRMTHAGVVSWNVGCGEGGPSVFARTSNYLPWILRCIRSRGRRCSNHLLLERPNLLGAAMLAL